VPARGQDLLLELVGLGARRFDSSCERAQHEPCRLFVRRRGGRKAKAATALEQPLDGQPAQLLAEAIGRGHDHTAQLHERLAADVDGTPARDQQQPQRLSALPGSRQRQRLARERGKRGADGVEFVVLAAQAPLVPRGAANLEHRLAAPVQIAGQADAVVTGAFNRPDASTGRIALRESQRLRVATTAGRHRLPRDNRARRRDNDRQHMLVPMGVDADHVIHLICNHPDRSSGFCS